MFLEYAQTHLSADEIEAQEKGRLSRSPQDRWRHQGLKEPHEEGTRAFNTLKASPCNESFERFKGMG